MRLWYQDLIPLLPRQQLLGQHRECCALRGGGWGKQHATVNYVFDYSPYRLFRYHRLVMAEMKAKGYNVTHDWFDPNYRGKSLPPYQDLPAVEISPSIYPEHNDSYLEECLTNSRQKGIDLSTAAKK